MDPVTAFGVATAVIGLVPICANGYTFIEGICTAEKGVQKQLKKLLIQRRVIRAWATWWEITLKEETSGKDSWLNMSSDAKISGVGKKLHTWIQANRRLGQDVLDTLSDISDVFIDTAELEKKYGVVLKQGDPALHNLHPPGLRRPGVDQSSSQEIIKRKREHMNVLKRCHFQLKGGAKFDELRTSLQDLVDCLITICPNQTAIHMSLLGDAAGSSQIMDLETMRNIYEEEANRRREKGQSYQEYELVKDVAGFKARVQTLTEKRAHLLEERLRNKENPGAFLLSNGSVRFWNKRDVRYGEDRWEFREGNSTLAINDKDQLIHYIEWKSYGDSNGILDSKTESDILALADMFGIRDRPSAFRVLPCLGVLRDEQHLRFGFIYQPPPYIERFQMDPVQEGQISGPRMPETLLARLEGVSGIGEPLHILPLGDRFDLARKLVQSLYVMHASGWVHKNIRSDSVMFLPAESSYGGIPSTKTVKDLSNPYLCGFGYSRPGEKRIGVQTLRWGTVCPGMITLDLYHHPAKRVDESRLYVQAFDLYSLGAVLLEIGLWQPLETFANYRERPYGFRDRLVEMTQKELPGQVGKIYAGAVRECLIVKSDTTDTVAQQILCWKVSAVLDQCVA